MIFQSGFISSSRKDEIKARMKYHATKFELSVWFIKLSTYFYHTVRFTTNLSFQHMHTHTLVCVHIYLCVCVYIYIYIYIYIYKNCKYHHQISLTLQMTLTLCHSPSVYLACPSNYIHFSLWADVSFCWLANPGVLMCRLLFQWHSARIKLWKPQLDFVVGHDTHMISCWICSLLSSI